MGSRLKKDDSASIVGEDRFIVELSPAKEAIRGHPWKATLNHLDRGLLRMCRSGAVRYNAFEPDALPRLTADGERIWGVYALGDSTVDPWWEAVFTDSQVIITQKGAPAYSVAYAAISGIVLPRKSAPSCSVLVGGSRLIYDKAEFLTNDRARYEVRGAVASERYREIYLWHSLTACLMDQRRAARGEPD